MTMATSATHKRLIVIAATAACLLLSNFVRVVTTAGFRWPGTIQQSQYDVLKSLDWWKSLPAWPCPCVRLLTYGVVCDARGRVRTLRHPNLKSKRLSGVLPDALSKLSRLQRLVIKNTDFASSLPESLFKLTRLRVLDIDNSQLNGSLPASISQLRRLRKLALSRNKFDGSLPESIGALPLLNYISIEQNAFSGPLPDSISRLSMLLHLKISENQFNGSLPSGLSQLRLLTSLDAFSNAFSGGLEVVPKTRRLSYVRLGSNAFNGTIPDFTRKRSLLNWLDLTNNMFTGSIPASIGNMAQLSYLQLAKNSLEGSIPEFLSRLTRLLELDLSYNSFEGPVPTFLAALKSLKYLNLGYNKLSGSLAASAVTLPKLQQLVLASLQLTGPLPDLTAVTTLFRLEVTGNRFSGSIPALPWSNNPSNVAANPLLLLGTNFFSSFSPAFSSSVCDADVHGTTFLHYNCLPASTSAYCYTAPGTKYSQLQRNFNTCSVACASACPEGGSCFLMGDSVVSACPCDSSSYPSFTVPGACLPFRSNPVSLCLYPSNIFLQPFLLSGSASITAGDIDFTPPSPANSVASAFLPSPINLFFDSSCSPIRPFATFFALILEKGQVTAEGGITFALLASAPSSVAYRAGGLGYAGSGAGVAVEFDLSREVGDPNDNHVGINVGGSVRSLATTAPSFDMGAGNPTFVWIEYLDPTLSVYVSQEREKPESPLVSLDVDLCRALRQGGAQSSFYVGFTGQSNCECMKLRVRNWCFATSDSNVLPDPGSITPLNTGLITAPSALLPSGNAFSRFASAGYTRLPDNTDSWALLSSSSWNSSSWLNPVWDQGECGSCWAYTTVDSISSAYAILSNTPSSSPPHLPASQLLSSSAAANGPCGGGCPLTALKYIADISAGGSGLKKDDGSGNLLSSPLYPIVAFEKASFVGWFGLLLAVQHQPVMVHIQADAPSFVAYDGSYVYRESDCYSYNHNHVVLVVGFTVTGVDSRGFVAPFFIIRNSWGPGWGDQGYMRMGITGGDGVCGINVLPAVYPVIKSAADPCFSSSYPVSSLPSLNPCGGFTCHTDPANSSINTCDCTSPFVQVTNGDGSRTCAYTDFCSTTFSNPCKVGTCRNTGDGSYTCICPQGFYLGSSFDGSPSCAVSTTSTETTTYTVVTSATTAADVCATFGITLPYLQRLNPMVDFSAALPVSTVLNVAPPTPLTPCSVFYTARTGDTCNSVQLLFSLNSSLSDLSPGIDCSNAAAAIPWGTLVCVERDASKALWDYPCTRPYSVTEQDTCEGIRQKALVPTNGGFAPMLWMDFFRLNPGLNCDNLFVPSGGVIASSAQICLAVSTTAYVQGNCGPKCKLVTLPKNTVCANIMASYFQNSPSRWTLCNPKFKCVDPLAANRRTVCAPKCTSC